jgi:putative thioredoxin
MPDAPSNKSDWIIKTTDASFDADVLERSRQQPVIVDFWAEWCQPCRLLTPILEKLAAEYQGKFVLVKANTEQTPAAAGRFGVQSIPAVYGFRDGEVLDAFIGVLPEEQLRVWLDRLLPTEAEQRVAEARRLEADDATAAETAYREAITLDANLATAKIGLAGLLLRSGRNKESRELIEQLERRGHLEAEAQKIKAEQDVRAMGQQAGDVDGCRAAVAQTPQDLSLRFRLAEALAAAGQYEEALQTALQLIRDDKQQFGDSARQLMVDIFQLLPDDSELTSTYRRQLATALY